MFYSRYSIFFCILQICGFLHADNIVRSGTQCSYTSAKSNENAASQSRGSILRHTYERKWISQIFIEVQQNFHLAETASENCKKDFGLYEQHLQNQSAWAVRMLESTEWPQVGIFAGMTYHLGNFDECIMISFSGIRGQYCLVEGTYYHLDHYVSDDDFVKPVEWPTDDYSVWSAMKMYRTNPVRVNRQNLHWAMCIPSTCTSKDLQISLDTSLQPIFLKYGINISINVDEARCQIHKEPFYPQGYYNVTMMFGSIILLVVFATIYDVQQKPSDVPSGGWIHTFSSLLSAKANYKKLVQYRVQSEDMPTHFVKVFSMLFVIYGHRFFFLISFPAFDTERLEIGHKTMSCINLLHLGFADVFLCFSGYLIYRFNYPKIKSEGAQEIVLFILNRWLRLVPTCSLVALFIAYVLPYLSNGPLWSDVVAESEYCKSNWFIGFLAVSNIIEPDKMCFLVSWYVCVDFQLTLLASVLMLVVRRNKKIGIMTCVVTPLLFCTAFTFVQIYRNKFSAVTPIYLLKSWFHVRSQDEFTSLYVTIFPHAAPFLIGFLSAIVCEELKERKYQFSKTHQFFGIIISIFIGEYVTMSYGSLFYEFNRNYSPLESAIYGSLQRIFFLVPFVYIHCMLTVTGITILKKITHHTILIPLSRLSYSVFLINSIIQMYHTYLQRSLMATALSTNKFWWVTTDVVFSYAIGFLLHLFIEAPIGNITKILINNLSRYVFQNAGKKIQKLLKKRSRENLQAEEKFRDHQWKARHKISEPLMICA